MLSQAITFFTAGYETTSNLIAFTLYELCFHPDIQERLRLEIIEKIQSHDDIITYDAIQDMKYLNMVVSGNARFLSKYRLHRHILGRKKYVALYQNVNQKHIKKIISCSQELSEAIVITPHALSG